jgi:hypothetical protein
MRNRSVGLNRREAPYHELKAFSYIYALVLVKKG